jgi:hypothetical protein
MAKKKKKIQDEEPSKKILDHIEKMKLRGIDAYYAWCTKYSFVASFTKSSKEMAAEQEHFSFLTKEREMYSSIDRNPKKLIEKACDGLLDHKKIDRPFWKDFAEAICTSKDKNKASLKELLIHIQKKADFLYDDIRFGDKKFLYVEAMIKINDRRGLWLRDLKSWKAGTHNARRQFASLIRHLFCKYEIPEFFDSAWFRKEKSSYKFRDWFIHIGLGHNIRTVKTPIPLTKKMAHSMMLAPADYTIEGAIRWGQIHALGGDKRLISEVVATRLGKSFSEEKFWTSVISFFIQNPMLDRKHVGPIYDFIHHHKYKEEEIVVPGGRVERRPPPQPNFSMTQRDPEALLRQVDRWHGALSKANPAKNLYFKKSEIKDFVYARGKDEEEIIFRIKELLSGQALIEEGRALNHCVATYAMSCFRGHCSIWSLEKEHKGKMSKCLTVEVDQDKIIVQARGKHNRLPDSNEMNLLQLWATRNELTLSHYLSSIA